MRKSIFIYIILSIFNNFIFAQPGWSQIGGQLNDLTKEKILNCLNSDCRIKYITIDSSTDLNNLYILEDLNDLALRFELEKIPSDFSTLIKLQDLIIIGNNLTDVSELANLPKLKSLRIILYPKKELPKGIELLKNIINLEISGDYINSNRIEDILKIKPLTSKDSNKILFPDNDVIKSKRSEGIYI